MLWHQQYDHTWNFKSFATVITNQSVILTILFLQCKYCTTKIKIMLPYDIICIVNTSSAREQYLAAVN